MTIYVDVTSSGIINEDKIRQSEQALFSCKETIFQEPNHSEYITEIDHGTNIVRCSSWRNLVTSDSN